MSIYHGDWQAATIANTGTSTGEIDLGMQCDFVLVQTPTLDAGTLTIHTAEISGGTYQALGGSATASTTGATNYKFDITGGWRFIKVVSSGTQGADRTLRLRGGRN